ncbi:hypothetical protein SSS_02595 [Sarcoptes scabiei]|uniref:Uncharacterized protein n=1 Tax=Sarcoptes scabiei TaxID=52283 RepID=A0A834VH32_SARSC|nr:hypothetical protein SSS_02595 [Sarcoptes scabiei]
MIYTGLSVQRNLFKRMFWKYFDKFIGNSIETLIDQWHHKQNEWIDFLSRFHHQNLFIKSVELCRLFDRKQQHQQQQQRRLKRQFNRNNLDVENGNFSDYSDYGSDYDDDDDDYEVDDNDEQDDDDDDDDDGENFEIRSGYGPEPITLESRFAL